MMKQSGSHEHSDYWVKEALGDFAGLKFINSFAPWLLKTVTKEELRPWSADEKVFALYLGEGVVDAETESSIDWPLKTSCFQAQVL